MIAACESGDHLFGLFGTLVPQLELGREKGWDQGLVKPRLQLVLQQANTATAAIADVKLSRYGMFTRDCKVVSAVVTTLVLASYAS